ncbi:MAG: DNA polymerase III subunit alpha [Bacteroidota bacterium]
MYLNCHSHFSLRYGTLSVEELVKLAVEHRIPALALTDIHNTSACYDFVQVCRKAGIHPVIGMEFRKGDQLLYVALARNLNGFREINEFYSRYALQHRDFPELPPYWSEVYVIYPWNRRDEVSLSEHEFLGIHPSQVRQLLRSRYRHRHDKLVLLQPLTFVDKRGHNIHRLLRSIDHNVLLSKLLQANQAGDEEAFVPPDRLREIFADYRFILDNSEKLLSNCSFNFIFGQRRSRQTFTGGKYDDMLLLEKLAHEGMERRYGRAHPEAMKRISNELEIIDQLDFNAYFLITWDMVMYGRSRGFFHVGRGSGANSIVSYCLGITDVDPIELDLYFERFLNPKRSSPPDFDVDFSWKDRDHVIDYALKRYRHTHASLLATYTCFRDRGIIRELGKVFGLPKHEIDRLASRHVPRPADMDKLSKQVLHYAGLMEGIPNHLSIHAGGILISEAPIHSYTATNMPPKGFPITHFDMYVAEEIGLHKFDILSQRGLGHIQESVQIISETRRELIDIQDVDRCKQDPQVRKLLSEARTVGCFYIESPAMRMLLQKLHCEDYSTLVAASSIIRPGVASSGMMRAYIERHNGKLFAYAHPRLKELLEETHGIMVYQEDVIKVVHGFAGLDLADADLLRRAMSGKSRHKREFLDVREKYFSACRERGYPDDVVVELWRQIESFAGYSFSKAHSASFAVESFQSLYLKAYYPLEFMVAVINNFGGFYDTELYLHEARQWGAIIHPPCVNQSTYLTRLVGQDIYLGFVHMKDLSEKLSKGIEQERKQRGIFKDLADFTRRLPVSREQLTLLARVGAFRFTGLSKPHLLWDLQLHLKPRGKAKQAEVLFAPEGGVFQLPEFEQQPLEDAYDEMELLGFPLCSPFDLLPGMPEGCISSSQFPQHDQQIASIPGYLINIKQIKTKRNDRMQFAHFVDQRGDMFDATLFPEAVAKYPFTGRGIYLMSGKIVKEFGVYTIEVHSMKKLLFTPDSRQIGERWEQQA